jgi:hypothetical protein
VLGYDRAVAGGDTAAACNGLASVIRTQLLQMLSRAPKGKGLDCPKLLTAMFARIPPRLRIALRSTTVTEVRIKGDHGFALYHQPGVGAGSFPVMRDHGSWKVAAISGSILP